LASTDTDVACDKKTGQESSVWRADLLVMYAAFRKLAAEHKPAPENRGGDRELAGFVWAALQPAPAPAK
jgi:hypothetical protein